jgi:Rifampin ADP-ribosyl transferase
VTAEADEGPFYHGTKAQLRPGDLLVAGHPSNYRPDIIMNHIYFTALADIAGLAAALCPGKAPERVYIVVPVGRFEDDPNVTNKRFPGNPTRSYRSRDPLRIIAECDSWTRQSEDDLRDWREKLATIKGGIIN